MSIISIKNVTHDYVTRDENDEITGCKRALENISLEVQPGEFIAVLGHNGSGKSTFAKHLNAILMPTEGDIIVVERNTREEEQLLEIRKSVGMVFQNPDNQIISNVVEEDVAFGPENIGLPSEEIVHRVEAALEATGMSAYRYKSPSKLSGGQKQRVAIAGVLAMKPRCIVLDEPTAMLDPDARRDVLTMLQYLNEKEGITIFIITHYMEEAVYAKRILIIDGGKLIMDDTPKRVFSHPALLREQGLDVPQVTEMAEKLQREGIRLPHGIITTEEFVEKICELKS